MTSWYNYFQSQCWYRNTYLVNNHYDVVEKNNIYNSGCHFTCLSMMLNVNAAVLSSELSKQYYFEKGGSGFVWDNNKPNEEGISVCVPFLVTQNGIVENIKITLVKKARNIRVTEAPKFIKEHHAQGQHLICGNSEHSLLVAGEIDGNYFVWNPDTSGNSDEKVLINKNLSGEHTIDWLYSNYGVRNQIEFWVYQVENCT
ncbi:hypothetical protein [Vibrio sp. SCSIO 43086]|uniref:hypothetical protein n=1 Tax=Vibrio sp. SCSIO 43086 TaxID=2822845 RepID=UPI003DA88217